MSSWFLAIALFGIDPSDNRFARPRLEFTTQASCEAAAQTIREKLRDDFMVITVCYQKESYAYGSVE